MSTSIISQSASRLMNYTLSKCKNDVILFLLLILNDILFLAASARNCTTIKRLHSAGEMVHLLVSLAL